MPYPEKLKELIKIVEKTRPERVARKKAGQEVTAMTLDERAAILELHHPDYIPGTRRKLKIGPSTGYAVAHEFADILEAKSRVNPDRIDLNRTDYETDVLVLGGGGAGTSAALLAQENGARVILATKLRHGDANTMMAEGGIQVADKLMKDSPVYHYIDTMGGGHFTNVPELVYTFCNDAPDVIHWLEGLGMMFWRDHDGSMQTLPGAAFSRSRLHYAGDITGAEIMRVIRDESRNRKIDGKQFVYECEPRDIEASAFIRECVAKGKGVPTTTGKWGVWIDSPMLDLLHGEGYVKAEFPGKCMQFGRHGIDISQEPLLVYPTLHDQNGGIAYRNTGETSIPGLYMAGEVGGGVHGENRLMGNSLLDILVFGRIAGKNAAIYAREQAKEGKTTLEHVNTYAEQLKAAGIETNRMSPILLPDYTDPSVKARQVIRPRYSTEME